MSIQPGRTVYETSISTEKGATITSTLNNFQTLTVTTCSALVSPATPPSTATITRTLPGATYTSFFTATATTCSPLVGPESPLATVTLTRTLPGATFTSFFTAPGYNHSSIYTTYVAGPTVATTVTQYETRTLPGATFTAPGGSVTLTQYATTTLPGATITSIVTQPGENSTIISTETTTCYETVSTCSASPISPVSPASPPSTATVYATNYITKTIPTTYTAGLTCSDVTITITAPTSDWDQPGGYGGHSSSESWGDKPSGYGGAHTTSVGSWRRM